jgi:hypothetical protein
MRRRCPAKSDRQEIIGIVQVLTLVSKVPEDGHVTLPGRMCHRVVESASGRRTPRTRSAPIDRIISSFPAASLGLRARSGALISGRLSGLLCARYPADPSGRALPVPLVRGREFGPLRISVAGAEQEHDGIGPANVRNAPCCGVLALAPKSSDRFTSWRSVLAACQATSR